jgi:sulfite reductase (NADPH) flavoprotein alpha-component
MRVRFPHDRARLKSIGRINSHTCMFRKILFQAHWLVGITAGVILAIVGTTGAILAFETPIQNWLNRDVRTVAQPGTDALALDALTEAIRKQVPAKRIASLQISAEPAAAVRIVFAPEANTPGRGSARGETRYANPYTGELLEGEVNRGQAFFRKTRSIHRWLLIDELDKQAIGRQIVGAATMLCAGLALSGLYLRWPRRSGNWRVWLTFNPRLKGRSFLWHLHAVLGTWVLIGFLLMSLTGLYWSYNWYRNGLYAIASVEPPAGRDQRREQPRGEGTSESASSPPIALNAAWTSFKTTLGDRHFTTATLALDPGRPIEIRYLLAESRHDRANNVMSLDPATGEVLEHERYASKRTGEKFMASIFPLHSGSFFGVPGSLIYMFASLAMPVFSITGWMLYLDRRRRKRVSASATSLASARSTEVA